MSRILMSLSGEGRGHAARTLTILEMLADEHECCVLCPINLFQWIREATRKYLNVKLSALPSLHFRYDSRGSLSYGRSWLHAVPFIANLQSHLRAVRQVVESFRPNLAITDFEPLLPRVARELRIPSLSIDHQHFLYLLATDRLPFALRSRVAFLRPSIKLFCPTADCHLVSSFYSYPQRSDTHSYQQIGVLIRREFSQIDYEDGEHLLVYVRRPSSLRWIAALKSCGYPCRIYGFNMERTDGNLQFCQIDAKRFMRDLAQCKALISTAGNQLIGEALIAGKPVLAVPEPGNFEQQINSFFLEASGFGKSLPPHCVSQTRIFEFLEQAEMYRERSADYDRVGNSTVMDEVRRMLGTDDCGNSPRKNRLLPASEVSV